MLTTMLFLTACFGGLDLPEKAPATPAEASSPAAKRGGGDRTSGSHQLPGYSGPFVSDQLLTPTVIVQTPPVRLQLLRNEVFARYGRAFTTSALQEHFGKTDWYRVDDRYSDSWLTANDRANVALIKRFEGDTQAHIIKRGEYANAARLLTFVDAQTVEISDTSDDMYNWERSSRRWAALGEFVITWEGSARRWSPTAKGLSNVQLWELDHDDGTIRSVVELQVMRL